MIGIIGAMEEEVTILKRKLNDMNEINIAHVKFLCWQAKPQRGGFNTKVV